MFRYFIFTQENKSIYEETYHQIRQQLWAQIDGYFTHDSLQKMDSRDYLETLNFSDLLDIYNLIIQPGIDYKLFSKFDIQVKDIFQNLIRTIVEKFFKNETGDTRLFWDFIHKLISTGFENIKLVLKIFDLWDNKNHRTLPISEIIKKVESSFESESKKNNVNDERRIKFWITFLIEVFLLNNMYSTFERSIYGGTTFEQFLLYINKYGKIENILIDPFLNSDIINRIIPIFISLHYGRYHFDDENDNIEMRKINSDKIRNDIKYLESFSNDMFLFHRIQPIIQFLRNLDERMNHIYIS